ncbi:MAG: hypothetical protein Q9168_002085 [Polycauliona sp. 1 TL-2023]
MTTAKLSPSPDKTPLPFLASDYVSDGKKHLLLAASGSVATIKLPRIAEALSGHSNLSVRILLTKAAENFLAGQSEEQPTLHYLRSIPNVDSVFVDQDEWKDPWIRGAGILHIELRRWSDLLVIAPLSANSLAKMTTGLADSLLLSVVRAWDTTGSIDEVASPVKRIIVAPAMNTAMWLHPITKKQIKVLEEDWGANAHSNGWVEVLKPIDKMLACGDAGSGAMREWAEVVSIIEERLSLG